MSIGRVKTKPGLQGQWACVWSTAVGWIRHAWESPWCCQVPTIQKYSKPKTLESHLKWATNTWMPCPSWICISSLHQQIKGDASAFGHWYKTDIEMEKCNAQWKDMQIGSAWQQPAVAHLDLSAHHLSRTVLLGHSHLSSGFEASASQLVKNQRQQQQTVSPVNVNVVI